MSRAVPPATSPAADTGAAQEPVRAQLLQIAAGEFARRGFAGARLEQIAADAGTTRAMIYYYFSGREGLYMAVLEDAYNAIWRAEQAIRTDGLDPREALRRLVEFRVGYYIGNPTFVSLVLIENQQEAKHLRRARTVAVSANPSLEHTAAVLAQGQALGLFRRDVDVVDLYQVVVSMGFFNVANRHTFGAIFARDFADTARMCRLAADVVLRYVAAEAPDRPDAPGAAGAPRAARAPRQRR